MTSAAAELPVVVPRPAPLAGAWLLSSATLVSGVLAYAFNVIAARLLGPHDYGLVAVLWATMFICVVVLFRPLEQTIARAAADRLARGEEIRSVVRSVATIYFVLAAIVTVAGIAAWAPLRDRLFDGNDAFVAALLVGIVAYGVAYVLRGLCSGTHWFKGFGIHLLADGTTRVVVLLPAIVLAPTTFAAVAVAAAAAGGAIAPLVAGRHVLRAKLEPGSGTPFHLKTALAFAAPAAAIAVADQVLVNAGPLLVVLGGGKGASETAAVVFAATMLVRVPVFVFQGFAASLLPNFTRLHATADQRAFRRAAVRAAATLAAFAGAIVVFAASIGPLALHSVYGAGFTASRLELALLGIGVGSYLATATLSQGLLALGRVRSAAVGWCVAASLFLALYAVLPGGPLLRIAVAFAVATTLSSGALLVVLLSRRMRL